MGALSGSRERSQSTLSPPVGFDPERDKTTLLIANKDKPLAYLELDDATLGRFARQHIIDTNLAAGRDAVGREMPLVVSMAMHAKVALAHLYAAVFGECDHVWEMRLTDVSWKGMPHGGNWLITVQRLPASADTLPKGQDHLGLAGTGSGAVGEAETPGASPEHSRSRASGGEG